MNTLDYAWIPYYMKVSKILNKIKKSTPRKQFIIRLNNIYKYGGIIPLYTTYKQLDELYNDIISFQKK